MTECSAVRLKKILVAKLNTTDRLSRLARTKEKKCRKDDKKDGLRDRERERQSGERQKQNAVSVTLCLSVSLSVNLSIY